MPPKRPVSWWHRPIYTPFEVAVATVIVAVLVVVLWFGIVR